MPSLLPLVSAIPSPSSGSLEIGPLEIRAYGLMIALGVVAAVKFAGYRWERRGGHPDDVTVVAVWAVPAGLVGARLYHVITDYERFQGRWHEVVAIWQGGLGIWGGVALGALVGWIVARRRGCDATAMLDACAPAIPLAQVIGRLGNWFNQELFGRPTDLPWALRIDPEHRPEGHLDQATYHPTFLYEMVWNLLVVGLVLAVERRFRLRKGGLFAVYVAGYTAGRVWIEALRIDDAREVFGLRVNIWTSIVIFLIAAGFVVLRRRGTDDEQVRDDADEEGVVSPASADAGAPDDAG